MNKRKYVQKTLSGLLSVILLFLQFNISTSAEKIQYHMNLAVIVNGEEAGYIPAFDVGYENNMYLSLKGLAAALSGTEKAFVPVIERQSISITVSDNDLPEAELPGIEDSVSNDLVLPEVHLWNEEELDSEEESNILMNKLYLNEEERKYYSVILSTHDGYDAFMTPISLSLLLDLNMKVQEDRIVIDTSKSMYVSAEEMERSGYLQGINALAIGDANTGELFYGYQSDEIFPIASTTKLMTYLVFMDAVSDGRCSLEDTVTVSEAVEKLSNGPDGVITMEAGTEVPVRELLYGMFLPSSNESALAIAEYVAGDQAAFAELMNAKAAELGMNNAVFYNCHGLPCYTDQLLPAKTQNHVTAEEMFLLAAAVMNTYPQVTEFTSVQKYRLETFENREIKNTNILLYNMDNMTGLKTGTTNKAGACLITCVTAEKDGETHNLITVLLGAESSETRWTISELSARYAMEVLDAGGTDILSFIKEEDTGIPEDPEKVIQRLIFVYSHME